MPSVTLSDRTRAILIGVFILTAYGVLISEATDSTVTVLIADVISGLSVIGIAVLIFPYFLPVHKMVSYIYLLARLVEGGLMVVGGVLFLNEPLQQWRGWIYDNAHIYAFIIGGYLFYWLLFKSMLVPRFISVWGFAGISALLLTTILGMLNITIPALDYLLVLIITNEIFLAVWLMAKGFKTQTPDVNKAA